MKSGIETMKRLAALAAAMLLFCAMPQNIFSASAEKAGYIKVGLKYDSAEVVSIDLTCDSGLSLGTVEDGEYEELLPLSAYTEVTVFYDGGKIAVKSGEVLLSSDIGTNGCIMPFEDEILKIDGKAYRGGAYLTVNSRGGMDVINYTQLDDYVRGVLNAELNHGNPAEALKAQAVAARSFGAYNYGRHGAFDVCAGTHCQVYEGYSAEYEETNQAVSDTAGLAIYYDGEPVVGYYYKNSGGYTQDAGDVWSSKAGHLKAVKDEYSPLYPWEASFSFEEIERKLSAAGHSVGSLKSVEISRRNQSGAVETMLFTGTSGTAKVEKEKIRTLFGYSVLKSTMFSFTNVFSDGSGSALSSESGSGSLSVLNGTALETADTVYVQGAEGAAQAVKGGDLAVTDGQAVSGIGRRTAAVSAQTADGETIPEKETIMQGPVVFKGAGYGHGVGMAQDGAVAMAKKGASFKEILQYYYTDIELR